ncbi:pyridoxal phosphate enzyme (YggS family) [Arthrobacter roseus]|nr:pyridoxal phosphate enzyme (YggS family) [Arthrobacter roseus]
MEREKELAGNLKRVRNRIAEAVRMAGRSEEPELIVVTKYFPASDVRLLAGMGVSEFGENRDQEAGPKAAELEDLNPTWHFIGQLQGNKAKSVVRYARAVQSVDRQSLVSSLARAMENEQLRRASVGQSSRERLDCYLQVNLDPHNDEAPQGSGRGGARPEDLQGLADVVAQSPWLVLAGVMAVAPVRDDAAAAFDRLRGISDNLTLSYPSATAISAGMSADLEQAVAAGATHLRIGSDVLGARATVR